jgi:hypothetical protein
MARFSIALTVTIGLALPPSGSTAQDLSPLRPHHVWLPMTGVTNEQIERARRAGYDTLMLKISPRPSPDGAAIDFAATDELVVRATRRGMKVIPAILGWAGLGHGAFWDTNQDGSRIPDRLDPFWPAAMARLEWYFAQTIEHYRANTAVVAFAPTWGIYGKGGFTSFTAGRSPHALARFNEWLKSEDLHPVEAIPTRQAGPSTDYNRFIRFRYLYVEERFDEMIARLKPRAGGRPVGMWQELYPIVGYLYNLVEVPSADFALYESCFPFQTSHHPEKTLAETMGFRYRCTSADEYRDYYLPLLARKRGEGQRFMGCQLGNDYAVRNYGWTPAQAEERAFDRWEDEFGPQLKKLLDAPLESPDRDVLLVFPTYAAAALSDGPTHSVDVMTIDVLLRSFGCQMIRVGSPRFDKLTVGEMDRFGLIVVPCADYLVPETYERLKQTRATVLFTGCFARSWDAAYLPFGQTRELDGMRLRYHPRPPGRMEFAADHPLTRGVRGVSIPLPQDDGFTFETAAWSVQTLARCDPHAIVSVARRGRFVFVHGHLFAGLAHDPSRKPPVNLCGSKDGSANEIDLWGPYSATSPHNVVGEILMKNILDHAGVDYRVPKPKPRTLVPYLGDHMEPASISANIVYNNTAQPQRLTVRLPYEPKGYKTRRVGDRYETDVTVSAFSYVALEGFQIAK